MKRRQTEKGVKSQCLTSQNVSRLTRIVRRTPLHSGYANPRGGILELLASDLSSAEVLQELFDLEMEGFPAMLKFAVRRFDHPIGKIKTPYNH